MKIAVFSALRLLGFGERLEMVTSLVCEWGDWGKESWEDLWEKANSKFMILWFKKQNKTQIKQNKRNF